MPPTAVRQPAPRHAGPPYAAVRRDGLARHVTLEPSRPLHLSHTPDGLTFAVVSIAWLRARPEGAREALALRHLAADEAAYGAALPVAKRRFDWLAGRLALKSAVRAYQRHHMGLRAAPAPRVRIRTVREGPRAGKPYVDGPVEIGLSHAGDFAVAVCGPRALGIDLEPRRTLNPYLARLLAVESPDGPGGDRGPGGGHRPGGPDGAGPWRERLHRMPLTLRWACKEAVLKHFGFGLRIGTGIREVELTGWRPDGHFTWRPGPELRRRLPAAGGGRTTCVAQEIDDYSLAMVWQ